MLRGVSRSSGVRKLAATYATAEWALDGSRTPPSMHETNNLFPTSTSLTHRLVGCGNAFQRRRMRLCRISNPTLRPRGVPRADDHLLGERSGRRSGIRSSTAPLLVAGSQGSQPVEADELDRRRCLAGSSFRSAAIGQQPSPQILPPGGSWHPKLSGKPALTELRAACALRKLCVNARKAALVICSVHSRAR